MKEFKCWDSDSLREHIITTFDHETASTEFAEWFFYRGDPFEELEVCVQSVDGGPVRTFTIDVDYDPTFSACEVEKTP